ncbi:signal recognition particle protein Ffh [Alcanivorax hongdengensis A-11-3]|uniref:Signal recognition particle protein n=1 Tax=Alcanivorax hongdengensis A-11-3 TaxID=1177179 RepID=L0WIG4_9GAMM|nr:signal recognition particle protein [Alcanivorax hongdengensis]EKF75635.1 signal recognition particle protein Ffh [Alcanivorax hongdengensis A-11-3]
MFENLTDRLGSSLKNLAGQGSLTEDNIRDTLREVRKALLEADVALPVVKEFVEQVKEKALGQDVLKSLNPGQAFVKIVNDELIHTMGDANDALNLATKPPAIILMAGLQGAGKTTSVAKLARFLQEREKKKVMVVSADVYRPAAIEQLKTLAGEVETHFFPSSGDQDPVDIANAALDEARRRYMDVLIVDTAGRLHVDEDMMTEIKRLHGAISPAETLFVVDAMTGQDAANTAQAFNEALPLTGVILTKADGDSRGGAALSVRHLTGKPIKFIGMGEKTDALEPFHPDRIASRILGMGDVLSLVEEAERKLDKSKAEKIAKKFKKGKAMDFEDLKDQFQQMRNMGGMAGLLDKLPGMGGMMQAAQDPAALKQMKHMEALIDSMTPKERRNPDLIKGSRKKRIAAGAGLDIPDLNRLMKQQKMMAKMMKKMRTKGGMKNMMRGLEGMMGGQGGPGGPGGMGGMGGPGGMPPM